MDACLHVWLHQLTTGFLSNHPQCKLHWQDQGTYLCVKVDRVKSKRSTFSNFELFRVKEKNYPVETIELKGKLTNQHQFRDFRIDHISSVGFS